MGRELKARRERATKNGGRKDRGQWLWMEKAQVESLQKNVKGFLGRLSGEEEGQGNRGRGGRR